MNKLKILIVDDELVVCKSCEKVFARRGYPVRYSVSGHDALAILEKERFDIVFTDLKMMDYGGMELLKHVKEKYPDTVVVVITGYATIASAVETMKLGAFDYLPKPFTSGELVAVLERAVRKRELMLEGRKAEEGGEQPVFPGIVGKSPKMRDVFSLIRKVALTDSTVLIMGESGTGKELVARAIHDKSCRKDEKFVAVDSGSLTSHLLASELFGYKRGAFTGAVRDKKGLFEVAHKGTIFLDEIGNVGEDIQGRLLRVLQEQTFLPLGGTEQKKVDVRVIFATNRDLKEMVKKGGFREDLYYRLYVFPIILPPLRERREDIPELAYWFLRKVCKRNKKGVPKISDEVLEALANFDWPGNVRQLENTIERMVVIADGDILMREHLPVAIFHGGYTSDIVVPDTGSELKKLKKNIRKQSIEFVEKAFIVRALEKNGWNVTRAAKDVNMQRPNFQTMMRRYNITRRG